MAPPSPFVAPSTSSTSTGPDLAQRWAVLVNGQSGPTAKRADRNRALRRHLAPRSEYFETYSLAELDAAAQQIRQGRFGTVAIAGGDGTVGQSLAALWRHCPPNEPLPLIALLRGGTMNTIARSLGITGNASPAARLQALQRAPMPHRIQAYTTLAVGSNLGFLFSSGIMYGFLDAYYATGQGALPAAKLLLHAMGSVTVNGPLAQRLAQRFTARLTLDGESTPTAENLLLVGAGTVPQVGLGFRPFPLAQPGAQCFHVLTYGGSLQGLLRGLPRLAVGQGHKLKGARSRACHELTLSHETPLPYALDGDLYRNPGPETTLRCGPPVRFLL